jgi:hypothetical protein
MDVSGGPKNRVKGHIPEIGIDRTEPFFRALAAD